VYVVAAVVVLVVLSVMAHATAYFPIDLAITKAVQSFQSPALDAAAMVIDWPGYVPQVAIILVVVGIGLFAMGYKWEAVVFWAANLLEGAVDGLIKIIVRRPRPEDNLGIHIYKPHGDFTYPSGHIFSYIMLFGLLAYFCYVLMKPSALRTLLVVALIALVVVAGPVRIYMGEHWPSDVLAGLMLGSLALPFMIGVYHWGQGRFFKTKAKPA
jgi:undecaprenyl-diphosphatase